MQYQDKLFGGYPDEIEHTKSKINIILDKYCSLCNDLKADDCITCELIARRPAYRNTQIIEPELIPGQEA